MGRHQTRHMGDGGDIVIPKDMRDRLGLQPGDEVTFEERENGEVVILPANGAGGSERRGTRSSARGGRSASRGGAASSSGRSSGSASSGRGGSRASSTGRSSRGGTSSRSGGGIRHAERDDNCF